MSTEFQYDVFLSHNQADKPRVRRLAERLRAAGLRVWFDEWVIQPGDDIYLAIERGLEASRTLVLCLSPAALGSDWVGLERSTVLFRDPANAGRRFIPLLLADCKLPDTLRRYKYVDYRNELEVECNKLLRACQTCSGKSQIGLSTNRKKQPDKGCAKSLMQPSEKVEISLWLYADAKGSPVHEYLAGQCNMLRATYGKRLHVHFAHQRDYSIMQQTVETGNFDTSRTCHVVSIDEIWLGELVRNGLLEDFTVAAFAGSEDSWREYWSHNGFITVSHHIALSREALWTVSSRQRRGDCIQPSIERPVAFPDRLNIGVLAFDPAVLPELEHQGFELKHATADSIQCERFQANQLTWDNLVDIQACFTRQLTSEVRLDKRKRISPQSSSPRVFSFGMANQESCVSFLLELLLSLGGPFPVETKGSVRREQGRLRWKGVLWDEALGLMLKLLDPSDIQQLARQRFRDARMEPASVFSRQWFADCTLKEVARPALRALELPLGRGGIRAAVSGAWYLGILKGSKDVQAGIRIMTQLASHAQEIEKLIQGVGLPLRRKFYSRRALVESRRELLYASEMLRSIADKADCPAFLIPQTVIESRCPFCRDVIRGYRRVSPLLHGMMAHAAELALGTKWLWSREERDFQEILHGLRVLVAVSEKRYKDLDREYMFERASETNKLGRLHGPPAGGAKGPTSTGLRRDGVTG